jgi:hypothetical protein
LIGNPVLLFFPETNARNFLKEEKMRLSSLTMLGFEINAVWDTCPDFELTFEQVHSATREGKLIPLLVTRFGELTDLSLLTSQPEELTEIESALCDAASALEGRERRKCGVKNSGICLVMAFIFEAIQQQFCPLEK